MRNFPRTLVLVALIFGTQLSAKADILTPADLPSLEKPESREQEKKEAAASAPTVKPSLVPEITGYGRLRFEDQARTSSFSSSQSFLSFRMRPNLKWTLASGAQFVVEPQFAKRMGAESYALGQDAAGDPTSALTETSGNTAYAGDPLTIFQGYLLLPLGESLSLKAGRIELKYGDERILGPGNWGLYGRSFDSLVLSYKREGLALDLFQSKVADFGSSTAQGDRDLNGLYLTWNPGAWIKGIELYRIERADMDNKKTATPDNADRNRYFVSGARLLNDWGGYKLNLEYAVGNGTSNFVADGSNAAMTVVNFDTPAYGSHKFGVEYSSAGENWNELYPTTNKALGRADVVGRRNLISQSLSWKAEWTSSWSTELTAYSFQRKSTSKRIYGTNGTTSFGSATSTASQIGQELDLIVSYKQNSATSWSLGAAAFSPGAYLSDTLDEQGRTDNREAHFAYVMTELKF